MEAGAESRADIQAKVLQSTLDEVASRADTSEGGQTECCVICLDSITEACEAKPCRHTNFDSVCLINWLEQQPKCPLCKTTITEVRYDFGKQGQGQWRTFVPEKREVPATAPSSHRRPRPPRRDWPYYRPSRRLEHSVASDQVTEDDAVLRRRQIYRRQLYSLHVGTNRITQYRELTPRLFEQDPTLISRARMWLRRELKTFEFLHTPAPAQESDDATTRRRANNAEFLLEYIVAVLKTVDIQGSQGQAEDMLQEFLGRDNTRLLLHELKSFLRSPFLSLEAWDRAVRYPSVTPRKRSSTSPATSPRPGSSRSSPRPPQQEDNTNSKMPGDSYRPRYTDENSQHVGSARRNRPR